VFDKLLLEPHVTITLKSYILSSEMSNQHRLKILVYLSNARIFPFLHKQYLITFEGN